jgi:hypothetical protein
LIYYISINVAFFFIFLGKATTQFEYYKFPNFAFIFDLFTCCSIASGAKGRKNRRASVGEAAICRLLPKSFPWVVRFKTIKLGGQLPFAWRLKNIL